MCSVFTLQALAVHEMIAMEYLSYVEVYSSLAAVTVAYRGVDRVRLNRPRGWSQWFATVDTLVQSLYIQ